jgi:putative acyl-CoA dehydrogenase
MRLKDKLGNKSNASSEIEYHGALATRLGEEGKGVKTIIEMVHHTRLGTISGTLGVMRRALAEAVNHVTGRRAFQKRLIDQPAMEAVIADLAIEYEAAAALVMRVARGFGETDAHGRAFARLAVALAKFRLTKRCPDFVYECMECHGGVGYVEETPLPRYYRDAPLNAIWEGSGNVIALDVLRTLAREPVAVEAYLCEVSQARGVHAGLDRALIDLGDRLTGPPVQEVEARMLVEKMALVLQACLLARHAPTSVADAFIRSRLAGEGGRCFGALPTGLDILPIIARQTVF